LYQDNQSTIKLLTNGRESSGDGTRHIRLRDYWVKDYVDRGELCIEYLPTADMRADILTNFFFFFESPSRIIIPTSKSDVIGSIELIISQNKYQPSRPNLT
jgi:hypothetical protein